MVIVMLVVMSLTMVVRMVLDDVVGGDSDGYGDVNNHDDCGEGEGVDDG